MPISPDTTLPGRINVATRKQHTELNRLLIQRLPLALPPHEQTALLFSRGLVPFANLFILFEREWELVTRQIDHTLEPSSAREVQIRDWLSILRPPGLARSPRLENDLRELYRIGGSGIYRTAGLGEQWVEQMRELIHQKPHVLVAFAWVFYMAVFSGGRWIRQQLVNSGIEFWTHDHSSLRTEKGQQPSRLEHPGIAFLSFDGPQDGEEVKASFKSRLADAEWLLREQEKQDVIIVAQQLFDRSIGIVHELDRMMLWQKTVKWASMAAMTATLLLAVLYVSPNRVSFLHSSIG